MKTSSPLRRSCFAGLSALALSVLPAQATLFDFNTPGQLTGNFSLTGNTNAQPTETASGGLSNSGWLVTGTTTGNGERSSLISLTPAGVTQTEFTLSVYFKWAGSHMSGTGELFGLGIGRDENSPFTPKSGGTGSTFSGVDQFHAGLGIDSSGNIRFAGSEIANDTLTNFTSGGSVFTMVTGNWYRLEVAFQVNGNGNGYDTRVAVINSNADGVPGTEVSSFSRSIINPDLLADDVHGYLMQRAGYFSGAAGFDNLNLGFQPIPEPSTAAIVALGAACLGLKFHRRKR